MKECPIHAEQGEVVSMVREDRRWVCPDHDYVDPFPIPYPVKDVGARDEQVNDRLTGLEDVVRGIILDNAKKKFKDKEK